MAEKKFMLNENQMVWNFFYNSTLEAWMEENKELENRTFTEEEKVDYSKKTYGNISSKNITPFNYELYKKKISIAQYKPIVIAFEQHIKKSFNDITVQDIESFIKVTDKKSKLNHLNSFLIVNVTNGFIKVSESEVLISLLPEAYRKLGRMIAGNNIM